MSRERPSAGTGCGTRSVPATLRGATLVEMLIVIAILAILAGIAIPQMQPALESRRIREAARGLNVYLGSTRNRAIATGRPCGVLIRRFDTLRECSMIVEQIEQPVTYSGDILEAAMRVRTYAVNTDVCPPYATVEAQVRVGDFQGAVVKKGDWIRFNEQGPPYLIVPDDADPPPIPIPNANPDSNGDGYIDFLGGNDNEPPPPPGGDGWIDDQSLELRVYSTHIRHILPDPPYEDAPSIPWPKNDLAPPNDRWSMPMPYEVFRQPVKTAAAPYQLPAGTIVDLNFSGRGGSHIDSVTGLDEFRNPNDPAIQAAPVLIMFSPEGAIYRLHVGNVQYGVVDPVYLLVGRRDRVPIPLSGNPLKPNYPAKPSREELPNWIVPGNLWLSLGPKTGLVTVAENDYVDPAAPGLDWTDPSTWSGFIYQARTFARQAQGMGGR